MGIDPDPTKEFLAKLADDSQWAVRRNIPIFEPHVRGDVVVTPADLQTICDRSNRLLTEKGVPGRLTDRHTIRPRADGGGIEPASPRPVLYGFQKNYRVGTYGPNNTPCILVDWYIYPAWADQVDHSPHRSVEYQTLAGIIRGTAVMVNDPYLDMGIVVHASGEPIYLYALGQDMPAMGPADANLPDDAAKKDKPDAPMHTPEEEKLFEKCRAYMCQKYGLDEGWPAAKKEPDAKTDAAGDAAKKEPVLAMGTNQVIATYEQKLGAMNARLAGLELERDQERCQMLLYGLEQEGFKLSDAEKQKELVKLSRVSATERPERLKELRAIYAERKVPQGMLDLYHGHVEPQGQSADNNPFAKPWYHDQAMAYMLDHPGMPYDAAVKHIQQTAAKK